MESLDNTEWDVVIAGTGVPQSLLALALSRSGKRVLHVDGNAYYGEDEAALNLDEAERWAERFAAETRTSAQSFSHARLSHPAKDEDNPLLSSRAYSLALAPQVLYARSNLITALISSRINDQLEFQAIGSWFVVGKDDDREGKLTLMRVPGGREDVFQDKAINLKAKRSLMKFLRFVANYTEQEEVWHGERSTAFSTFLENHFGLAPGFHAPILALTLGLEPSSNLTTEQALPRIARHLTSIGVFGPGFPAVLPKWGGLAELSQVACRACAVGGGVYVLNKSIAGAESGGELGLTIRLSDDETIKSAWLAGSRSALSPVVSAQSESSSNDVRCARSISIVSSKLLPLFPVTSEGGVTPAGAVLMLPGKRSNIAPVFVLAHSSESGECPSQQCILYSSTSIGPDESAMAASERVTQAVDVLISTIAAGADQPNVLWQLQYQQHYDARREPMELLPKVLSMPSLSHSLAIEDDVLENVRQTWSQIAGAGSEDQFLEFQSRADEAETSAILDEADA